MAIGSTVTMSALTVGSTIQTPAKARDGIYKSSMVGAVSGKTLPFTITLKPANPLSRQRSFKMNVEFDGNAVNAVSGSDEVGKMSISLDVNARLGRDLDEAGIVSLLSQFLSILWTNSAAVPAALVAGSLE